MKLLKKNFPALLLISALVLALVFNPFSADAEKSEGESHHKDHQSHESHGDSHVVPAAEFGPDYLIHHVIDSHDWHLFDIPADGGYKPVSIPLPVILFADGGVHFFMSSEFEHGHAAVQKGDVTFMLNEHGKVVGHDKKGNEISVMDFSITKTVVTLIFVVIIMILLFRGVAAFYKKHGSDKVPRGLAGFVEPMIIFVRDEIAIKNIGEKKYMKFMPYLLTVFFFIWISNLVGLLPLGFNLTGNLMVTFTLAIFTFILTTIHANKDYWMHIFWMPGLSPAMKIFMAPIEVIGMFTKPFALMIRLFANITAGHIVIMSLIGIMFSQQSIGWAGLSVPLTLFVMVLELLVAALQAYIFTMLSALFIGMAVQDHHH